jgi:hypothetical protein
LISLAKIIVVFDTFIGEEAYATVIENTLGANLGVFNYFD